MKYRHLRRTAIAVLAAAAIVLLLGTVAVQALHSPSLCRAAARALERQAGAAGVELRVGRLSWRLLPLVVQLDEVAVVAPGIEADIDRLHLGLGRLRVARRTVELDTVVVHGVRLRLEGVPRPLPRQGAPWVRLSVQRLQVTGLEVEGSELAKGVSVGLGDVEIAWASDERALRGYLRVGRADVDVRSLEHFAVALQARFTLADEMRVPRWTVRGRGVELEGSGLIGSSGRLQAEAAGEIDLAELDRVVRAKGVLEGRCRLRVDVDSSADHLVRAEVSARAVSAAGFPVEDLRGRLMLGPHGLTGIVDGALLYGGRLRGTYTLAGLRAPFVHRVRVGADGMGVSGFLLDLGVPPAGLGATADLDAELEWTGRSLPQGSGVGSAVLRPAPTGLPVAGSLQVRLEGDGLLHFSASDLAVGRSRVQWQGPLTIGSWQPAWSVQADPAELGEIIPVVNRWVGSEVLPPEITGSGELAVSLSGPWRQLRVAARLEARPLDWSPMHLDRVVGEAVVAGSEVAVGPVRFRVGDGDGEVTGRIAWAVDEVDLSFRGHNLPIEDVVSWVGVGAGCTGRLSFAGGLRGALSAARGSWAVGLTDVSVASLPLGDGTATVELADATFTVSGVSFTGGLSGSAWWRVASGELGGDLEWPRLPAAVLPDPFPQVLADELATRIHIVWPLDGPPQGSVDAVGEGCEISLVADAETVTVNGTIAGSVDLTATLDRVPGGGLIGSGELVMASAEHAAARLLPEADVPLAGHGRALLDIEWSPGGLPNITGQVDVLALELDGRPVVLLEPAGFSASAAGFEVDGALIGLLDDQVFVRWGVHAGGAMWGNVAGTVDALLLRFLVPDWAPSGRATGVVEILGTVDRPRLEGIAEVNQVLFRIPGTRSVVSGVNGTVLLSSDEIALDGVEMRFMGGTGRCFGRIGRSRDRFELGLSGTIADLEYPLFPGLTARLDGSWRLHGPVDDLELAGELEVVRAALRRRDDVATILIDWFSSPEVPRSEGGLRLDIDVDADRTIEATSPFLHLVASADLHVGGTTGAPAVLGKIELEEGGDLSFQGLRYDLERGTVTLSDPMGVEPNVDLEARAWVASYQITVRLTGTPDRLVPVLSSDPPLPEDEIISLLALGYRDQTIGGGAVGVGLASTLLTRQINAELERRARSLLDIDQVRIDPFAEASTGNPTARITVVKQLSPTWTVMLQSNLSANRQEVVVSRWFLGPGLFIEATRDLDGSVGVDLKMRRRY